MFQNRYDRWFFMVIVGLIWLVPGCVSAQQPTVEPSPEMTGLNCPMSNLVEDFPKVKLGASRTEVTACLGRPGQVNDFELAGTPIFGPSESLASILQPDTPVEEWVYRAEGQVYYLWFASTSGGPKERWQLVDKATYPDGAVFEAE